MAMALAEAKRRASPRHPAKRGVSRETGSAGEATAGIVPAGAPVESIRLDVIEVLPGNPEPDADVVAMITVHGQDEPVILLAPGQLQTPANVGWDLRPDAYMLLAGATRLQAARELGQATIEARVRYQPLGLEDAIAFALRSNTGRRLVTTAEKAGRIEQLYRCGLEDDSIAARLGIRREEVNQLRRMSALPAVWRARLANYERSGGSDEDGLSWGALKALLPYADVQAVLEQLELGWGDDWDRGRMRSRDGFREAVKDAVLHCARPIAAGEAFWDSERGVTRTVPDVSLDNAAKARLQLREVQVDGTRELLAFCPPEVYDEVFPREEAGRENGSRAARTEPSGPAVLSPAEQRAKQEQADDELLERIVRPGGLRDWALRIACATSVTLRPGKAEARQVWRLLSVLGADKEFANHLDPATWIVYATHIWGKRTGLRLPPLRKPSHAWDRLKREDCLPALQLLGTVDDPLDAHEQIEALACELILFPQTAELSAPGLSPLTEFPAAVEPWIDAAVLEAVAMQLGATVAETWDDARLPHCPEAQQWLRKFLAAHDRRQLVALAEEIVPAYAADDWADRFGDQTKAAMLEQLEAEHGSTTKGLTMPASLGGKKVSTSKKRKGNR